MMTATQAQKARPIQMMMAYSMWSSLDQVVGVDVIPCGVILPGVAAVGQVDLFGRTVQLLSQGQELLALFRQLEEGVTLIAAEFEVGEGTGLLEGVDDLIHLEGGVLKHAVRHRGHGVVPLLSVDRSYTLYKLKYTGPEEGIPEEAYQPQGPEDLNGRPQGGTDVLEHEDDQENDGNESCQLEH